MDGNLGFLVVLLEELIEELHLVVERAVVFEGVEFVEGHFKFECGVEILIIINLWGQIWGECRRWGRI